MVTTQRPEISVGIPAHNEEKNILNIIQDILTQKKEDWTLKEIIVYCDSCTDSTASIIKQIRNERITMIENAQRKGKVSGMNAIIKKATGNVIFFFDADVRLGSVNVINLMLEPLNDPKVMVTGGSKQPYSPINFMQKSIYSTYLIFHESAVALKGGNNIFGCQGSCMALRDSFAKRVQLPQIQNDDAYIYLKCISEGFRFRYVDSAPVYYKIAATLPDYFRQIFRSTPESVNIYLNRYFGNLVNREFHRPLPFFFLCIGKTLIKNPLPTLFIIVLNILSKPFIPFFSRRYKAYWPAVSSTK